MRVLGIDPGSRWTGWGVLEGKAGAVKQLGVGVVVAGRGELSARLGAIATEVERLIEEWRPESVAVERAFVGKNSASALRIGEVRGAVLATAGRAGLPVVDYPPATVKAAVTGYGVAEKGAVARAIAQLLGGAPEAGDATDALAVALCHLRHASFRALLRDAAPPAASQARRRLDGRPGDPADPAGGTLRRLVRRGSR